MTSSITDHGTTRDGLIQLRRRWHPEGTGRGAVLLLHGIAEHSGRYEHVGRRLADAGLEVVAIDHRGYGRSGGRRGHVDAWSQFTDDVEDQLREVQSLGLPTVILGHSMGGLIAARYVIDTHRPRPDLLVLSGPAFDTEIRPHLRVMAPLLSRVLPTLEVREDGDPSMLSIDPQVGEVFYADPLRVPYPTVRLGTELMRTMRDARTAIERITVPTLVVHGGDDRLVPTEASAILESLPNVTRTVYPGLRHEVFNEPSGLDVVDDVISWLDERLASL